MQIYLSYAREDASLASRLAASLEKVGLEVWWAGDYIYPGDNWAALVGKALEDADAMVVLFTPKAATSYEIEQDISFALGGKKFKDRLVPVILDVGSFDAGQIPGVLKQLRVVHLRVDEMEAGANEIAEALGVAA